MLLKNKYLGVIILLFFFIECTDTNKPKQLLEDVVSSSDSLDIYLSIANNDKVSYEKRKLSNQKANSIIINQSNDSLNRANLFKVANRYFNMNDSFLYKKTVKEVLQRSLESDDTLFIAKSNSYLGDYYSSQRISDSSFMYYYKAEKLYSDLNDKENLARTLINKALLQFNESDFLGSQNAVVSALREIKNNGNKEVIYESYNLLGIIYNELEDFDNAILYHNKALNEIDDKSIPSIFQSKATSLNNLGYVSIAS